MSFSGRLCASGALIGALLRCFYAPPSKPKFVFEGR